MFINDFILKRSQCKWNIIWREGYFNCERDATLDKSSTKLYTLPYLVTRDFPPKPEVSFKSIIKHRNRPMSGFHSSFDLKLNLVAT